MRISKLFFLGFAFLTSNLKADLVTVLSSTSSGDVSQVQILNPIQTTLTNFDLNQSEGVFLAQEIGVGTVVSQTAFNGFLVDDIGQYPQVKVGDIVNASLLFHWDPTGNNYQTINVKFDIDTTSLPLNSQLIIVSSSEELVASDFLNNGQGIYSNTVGRQINGGIKWGSDSPGIINFEVDINNALIEMSQFRLVSFTAVPESTSVILVSTLFLSSFLLRKKLKI